MCTARRHQDFIFFCDEKVFRQINLNPLGTLRGLKSLRDSENK